MRSSLWSSEAATHTSTASENRPDHASASHRMSAPSPVGDVCRSTAPHGPRRQLLRRCTPAAATISEHSTARAVDRSAGDVEQRPDEIHKIVSPEEEEVARRPTEPAGELLDDSSSAARMTASRHASCSRSRRRAARSTSAVHGPPSCGPASDATQSAATCAAGESLGALVEPVEGERPHRLQHPVAHAHGGRLGARSCSVHERFDSARRPRSRASASESAHVVGRRRSRTRSANTHSQSNSRCSSPRAAGTTRRSWLPASRADRSRPGDGRSPRAGRPRRACVRTPSSGARRPRRGQLDREGASRRDVSRGLDRSSASAAPTSAPAAARPLPEESTQRRESSSGPHHDDMLAIDPELPHGSSPARAATDSGPGEIVDHVRGTVDDVFAVVDHEEGASYCRPVTVARHTIVNRPPVEIAQRRHDRRGDV